ncbi:unnamed protein product [Clavelina lepadiformis]|uniref:Uncharacterized protein n=1 Tax=Clavelina lepadiformis TaxID=159417 RepID=A0ABP0G1J6_CLALP
MKKFTSANYGNGNNAGKVNFFQYFPKDFIRPYGLATTEASGTPEDFNNKLKCYSCERLCRPGIAFSEFSETMRANWARIQQERQSLAADKPFKKLSEEFETIMELCNCLQSPESSLSSKKMKRTIKSLMERVQNNSELFDAYQELFFSLGSSMYLTSVHLGAAKFVFSNLDEVKRLCSEGKTNLESFKKEPTRKNYVMAAMEDLTQKAQKVSSTSPRKRSIAEIIAGISAVEDNDSCTWFQKINSIKVKPTSRFLFCNLDCVQNVFIGMFNCFKPFKASLPTQKINTLTRKHKHQEQTISNGIDCMNESRYPFLTHLPGVFRVVETLDMAAMPV